MKPISVGMGVGVALLLVIPKHAQAHPPGRPCLAPFGGPGICNWFFPLHLHQHGPLYNYGPYYGYPPFEPYGPWTANLQYNPLSTHVHYYGGRLSEDKSGHGGLLTQWRGWGSDPAFNGGFLNGGWGSGRFGGGLSGGRNCPSCTGSVRLTTVSPKGSCSGCSTTPTTTAPANNGTK